MSSHLTPPTLTWEPETFEQGSPITWSTITDRLTSWVLITATMGMMILVGYIWGATSHDGPAAVITPPPPAVESIQEDDPRWNCLTMGNGVCGPEWESVETATLDDGSPMMDVLVEGDRTDWTGCLTNSGPTVTIVCPDGYTEVWS